MRVYVDALRLDGGGGGVAEYYDRNSRPHCHYPNPKHYTYIYTYIYPTYTYTYIYPIPGCGVCQGSGLVYESRSGRPLEVPRKCFACGGFLPWMVRACVRACVSVWLRVCLGEHACCPLMDIYALLPTAIFICGCPPPSIHPTNKQGWRRFWLSNLDIGNGGILQRPAPDYEALSAEAKAKRAREGKEE